MTETDSQ